MRTNMMPSLMFGVHLEDSINTLLGRVEELEILLKNKNISETLYLRCELKLKRIKTTIRKLRISLHNINFNK